MSEPKVTVTNNEFVCAREPKLSFKVPANFTYLGHVQDFEETSSYEKSTEMTHRQADSYIFVDNSNSDSPIIVSFKINQLAVRGWYFFNDLHDRLPENRYFERDRYKLGNTNFWTATFVGSVFSQKELSYLVAHDIKIPRLFTIRQIEGTVTLNGSVKFGITYAQDIRELNNNAATTISLTESQKVLLNDFIGAANSFFGGH